MTRTRIFTSALIGAGIAFASIYSQSFGPTQAFAAEEKSHTVRPEVGKPILAAQQLQKSHKYSEALAALHKADAVSEKTSYETYVLELTRGSIASQAGDKATAVRSFQAVLDSGMASPEQRLNIPKAIAGNFYNDKNYPEAITWTNRFFKEGGDDPNMRTLLLQSYYLSNNFAETIKIATQQVAASERAKQRPNQTVIEMWANSAVKLQDKPSYNAALLKLVAYYPQPKYWTDLIHRAASAPGFADRLALDAERLEYYVGALTDTNDVMDMIQLALQEGLPGEAQSVVTTGYQKGYLGTGPDAARQNRLRTLVQTKVAEDQKDLEKGARDAAKAPTGDGLVNIGFSYLLYGQTAQGLSLMEQGMAKDSLKHPSQSKLHLGIAYLKAGQKAKALQIFGSITDTDGSGELAHLWRVAASQGS